MSRENIFTILQRNDLSCCGINYNLYEEFSKTIIDEKEIAQKINEYNSYIENNNNKYSEKIMQYLRQRDELGQFDYSNDKELNELSSNEVFENVVSWNGLSGGYAHVIKGWVREIYGVDLDNMEVK